MVRARESLFARKVFVEKPRGGFRMQLERPLVRFDELHDDDLLTKEELMRYFGCSRRTIIRWVNERGFTPDCWYRQQMLFYKRTVIRWEKSGGTRPWGHDGASTDAGTTG